MATADTAGTRYRPCPKGSGGRLEQGTAALDVRRRPLLLEVRERDVEAGSRSECPDAASLVAVLGPWVCEVPLCPFEDSVEVPEQLGYLDLLAVVPDDAGCVAVTLHERSCACQGRVGLREPADDAQTA